MNGRVVIGVDEAGYGPSMGPLVLGGTAWWVPDRYSVEELSEELSDCFQSKPSLPRHDYLSIGDSKKILKGKYGWPSLSLAAQWLLWETGNQRFDWSQLARILPDDWGRLQLVPWYRELADECSSPSTGESAAAPRFLSGSYLNDLPGQKGGPDTRALLLEKLGPRIAERLSRIGVRLLGVQARWIDEPEFNRFMQLQGNKSTVLSELSLKLAVALAERFLGSLGTGSGDDSPDPRCIEMFFDKHGGRNRYQPLVMDALGDVWVQADTEGARLSSYRARWRECEVQLSFRVGGDSYLPSGAASVLAKWLRELSMASLNAFWEKVCGRPLRPTAGYYVDALRFANEIEETADRLGIMRTQWWRSK